MTQTEIFDVVILARMRTSVLARPFRLAAQSGRQPAKSGLSVAFPPTNCRTRSGLLLSGVERSA